MCSLGTHCFKCRLPSNSNTLRSGMAKEVQEYTRLFPDSEQGKRRGCMEFSCMKEATGSTTSATDRGQAQQALICCRCSIFAIVLNPAQHHLEVLGLISMCCVCCGRVLYEISLRVRVCQMVPL